MASCVCPPKLDFLQASTWAAWHRWPVFLHCECFWRWSKLKTHRSGGTQPSVLISNHIIFNTWAIRKTEGEGRRGRRRVQRGRGASRSVLIRVPVPWAVGGWHNFCDPLSTIRWLAGWAQSCDQTGASECEHDKRLSSDACACIGCWCHMATFPTQTRWFCLL